MQRFKLTRREVLGRFKELEAEHHIVLVPGTQRILMANPFSAVSTPFRVYFGSARYFANCAWDSVAIHVMIDKEARIESFCHHCADSIEIDMADGKVKSSSPPSPIIFLSVPVAKWYDDLINTCSNNMVYFASKEHLDHWMSENQKLRGVSLSVEKMAEVCRPLAKGRMGLEFERPPKEELTSYWASVGMKGSFWDF